ncbi:MAG: 30S ribosomal protein S5, partial [Parcubacteria group bacterium]|nr:30S ribosomal protein S5 [Parcubacteria group bacterium]
MDATKTKKETKPKLGTKTRDNRGAGHRHGAGAPRRGGSGGAFGGGEGKGGRSRRPSRSRSGGEGKNEFAQKVLSVRRVARVVQGGRRFSFSTTVVIGDRNGAVGLGTGKASDTALAIEKAIRDA